MDKYPILKFIKQNAQAVSLVLALLGLGAGLALWPILGPWAIAPAAVIGLLAYLAGRTLAELVRLITDVLMPE